MRRLTGLLLILLVIHVLAIIILGTVPPFSRDAIIHHLAIPHIYWEQGAMVELPAFFFSYYPPLLDLLYIPSVALNVDYTAKYVHFVFALLTAWLLYRFLRERVGLVWGLLGAWLFLSVPVIVKLSVTVYVDLGLIFFSTGALLGVAIWLESRKFRWLVLASVACGLALSTKYNGLLTWVILSACVPFFYLRSLPAEIRASRQLHAVGFGFVFFLVALLVFSPWLVRNYIWTGNPIYPLAAGVFDSSSSEVSVADDSIDPPAKPLSHLTLRKLLYEETPLQTLTTPIRIFFVGEDNNPKLFDGKLNFALLLFPMLLLLVKFLQTRLPPLSSPEEKNEEAAKSSDINNLQIGLLVTFATLFILLGYLATDMRVRYISPAIPPLVILSVLGLSRLFDLLAQRRHVRWGHGLVAILVISAMLPNLRYLVWLWQDIAPIHYLRGQTTRIEFLSEKIPSFAATHYINQHLPQDSKILAVYLGQRAYYFQRQVDFNYSPLLQAMTQGSEVAMRYLQTHSISHLLIRFELLKDWLNTLSRDERDQAIKFMQEQIRSTYQMNGYGLFELVGVDQTF